MDNYDAEMLRRAGRSEQVVVKLGGGRTSLAELHYWQVSGGFRNRRAVVKLPGGAVVNVRQSCVMLPEGAA